MTTTNPWGREPLAPELAACKPILLALMKTLHNISRADPRASTLTAVTAVIELANTLITSAGLLWVTPDMVAALRTLADDLEAQRKDEPPQPLLPTLGDFFADAPTAAAN